MLDVANNRHDEVFEAALVLANGHKVEQTLGGMRDVGLARVEDADVFIDVPGDVRRNAGARITHDHDVYLHRLQRVDHVEDALALLARRGVDVEVQYIRT